MWRTHQKVKHTGKQTSKQMNKFAGLKFLYRNPAPVLWSVCVCVGGGVSRSGSGEEMTFAWHGCIMQGPPRPPPLGNPPASSLLTGCEDAGEGQGAFIIRGRIPPSGWRGDSA